MWIFQPQISQIMSSFVKLVGVSYEHMEKLAKSNCDFAVIEVMIR